jgi:hypothetical protein
MLGSEGIVGIKINPMPRVVQHPWLAMDHVFDNFF